MHVCYENLKIVAKSVKIRLLFIFKVLVSQCNVKILEIPGALNQVFPAKKISLCDLKDICFAIDLLFIKDESE